MSEPSTLLALVDEPLLAAVRGRSRRESLRGREIRIVPRDAIAVPSHAAIVSGGVATTLDDWPAPRGDLHDGDHVVIQVGATQPERERWVRWLLELASAEPPPCTLAPCSTTAAGLHPLWCIAVARMCLPPQVVVEARHDLLGIRLAQVALGFGAEVLSGPIDADRHLPLCGVTRPDEATAAGLATLVRHAGLVPVMEETR
jgi:hypothetical protein